MKTVGVVPKLPHTASALPSSLHRLHDGRGGIAHVDAGEEGACIKARDVQDDGNFSPSSRPRWERTQALEDKGGKPSLRSWMKRLSARIAVQSRTSRAIRPLCDAWVIFAVDGLRRGKENARVIGILVAFASDVVLRDQLVMKRKGACCAAAKARMTGYIVIARPFIRGGQYPVLVFEVATDGSRRARNRKA